MGGSGRGGIRGENREGVVGAMVLMQDWEGGLEKQTVETNACALIHKTNVGEIV